MGVVALVLFAAGCGGSSNSEELEQVRAELDALREQVATTAAPPTAAPATTTAAQTTTAAPAAKTDASATTTAAPVPEKVVIVEDHLGDGSLGTVEVGPGEEIQIRSLNAISGDVAFLGIPNQRGVELAIVDYGPIGGHYVTMGTGLDDLCSADGGQAAAQAIVADESVVGVIGTSCSGAAAGAAPLISEAGMVMISPSNTSPSLTSDLAGRAGWNNYPGYYRTAHNDLYQGAAAAKFAVDVLGVSTAAAIHDGDPYTQGLAQAFADAFEVLGGTITTFTAVNKGDIDMVPVLTEVAAGGPEMLFFPIFQPEGNYIIQQASQVPGLGRTTMMAADGLLNSNYMALTETEGMYFSGPDIRYGTNYNQSTGQTADAFLAAYNANWGEDPAAPFWAHSYDATTLLLDAIAAASYDDSGTLVIDRAGVREYLGGVRDYSGIIGLISCDAFGDCGSQKITVIGHVDSDDIATSNANVVYVYAPEQSDSGLDQGRLNVQAMIDASRSVAVSVPTATTRAPQGGSGPYGVTLDDQYMMECLGTGGVFLDYVSTLATVAGNSSSYAELGSYFVEARNELLGNSAEMTATMFMCEDTYPRLFQSTISAIGDWLDACAQVSRYSSTSTDERCISLTNSGAAELRNFTGRLTEVAEWVTANS